MTAPADTRSADEPPWLALLDAKHDQIGEDPPLAPVPIVRVRCQHDFQPPGEIEQVCTRCGLMIPIGG